MCVHTHACVHESDWSIIQPITSVQQHNSVTYRHSFFILFSIMVSHRRLDIVPRHTVGPCCLSILSIYDSLHLLIPNSQSSPPQQHYSRQLKHDNNLKIQRQINGKEDVVHMHNGILLSHEKERDEAICSNIDASRMHFLLRSQRPEEENIPYCERNSIYLRE